MGTMVGSCKPLQGLKTFLPLIAMGLTGAWAACNDEGHKGATPAPDTPRPFSAAGCALEIRCWGHSEQSLFAFAPRLAQQRAGCQHGGGSAVSSANAHRRRLSFLLAALP